MTDIREIPGAALTPAQAAELDAIFFEASGRSFGSARERAEFRERWLGRYLQGGSDVLLAACEGPRIVGYLVGALADPAEQPRFDDIPYFKGAFRDLCRAYPAHLHINMAAGSRGGGTGARLIEAFAIRATAAGAPGMHVVTGRDARNVRFYGRCGFRMLGITQWNRSEIAFLARPLT